MNSSMVSQPTSDEIYRHSSTEYSAVTCFLLGLAVMIPIAPESRLTLFDLIAGSLVLRHWHFVQTRLRSTAIILSVSVGAMAISSYLNQSEIVSLIGRAYQPIALLLEVAGYLLLIRGSDVRGRSALVLGAMVGISCHYFYPSDLRVIDEPIKFLLGIPLGVAALCIYTLVLPHRSLPVLPASVFMGVYAIFCFLLGSRSIGGVYFACAIAVILIGAIRVPKSYAKFAPLLIAAFLLSGYIVTEIYTNLAIDGYFGDRAAGIAAFQSSFGSILLGGRPEIIVNISGIRDAPFFGVGINSYSSIYLYEMSRLAIYSEDTIFDAGNVLYHSTIFATAFESGIISTLFWLFLFYRSLFVIPLLREMPTQIRIIVLPLFLMTIWHLLYSPPIPYNRFVMAIGLSFSYYIYFLWKDRQNDRWPPSQDVV